MKPPPTKSGKNFSPTPVPGVRRAVLIAAGLGFVGLSVLGAILPVLPTTPFLLLASWCFIRSDPRWNDWLLRNRWFGPLLRDWQEKRGVRRSVKTSTLVLVPCVLAASIGLGQLSLPLTIVILALGSIGITIVARLPVVNDD